MSRFDDRRLLAEWCYFSPPPLAPQDAAGPAVALLARVPAKITLLPRPTRHVDGILLTAEGCWRHNQTQLRCDVMGTSPEIDRVSESICQPVAVDEKGNNLTRGPITLNGQLTCNFVPKFLADTPIKFSVNFYGLPTDATQVKTLAFGAARLSAIAIQREATPAAARTPQ